MCQNLEEFLVLLEAVLLKRTNSLDDLFHGLSPRRAGGIASVVAPAAPLATAWRVSRNLVDLSFR